MSTYVAESKTSRAILPARPQRAPQPYSLGWAVALVISDVSMLLLSSYGAARLVFPEHRAWAFTGPVLLSAFTVTVLWLFMFARMGLYRRSFALASRDEFYFTVAALCLGAAPQLILFTLVPAISTSRLVLLISLAFAIVSVGGMRAILHYAHNELARSRPRRIAIVGTQARVALAAESLNVPDGTELLRLEVGDVDETLNQINLTRDPELDQIAWFHTAKVWGCDTLLLTEILAPQALPHLLEVAARYQIKVAFAPPRIVSHAYSLSIQTDGQQALILPRPLAACTPLARLLKRGFDVAIALPLLVLCAPIMAVAALAVLAESGRPVFFRQERVGRNGRVFELFKFRSMRRDAERETGPTWARPGDGRTTRVGSLLRRTSIDELPQLFNVLRGEMSMVGPRPERPVFVETFRELLPRYDERHLVRPGITGWSQVQMSRVLDESSAGEKLSYDLYYVEHWSLLMDVSVLFKTLAEFLFHRAG
jgi:exopolysaccharide biosynthesis polyprenyl glycosylphosphotransferase